MNRSRSRDTIALINEAIALEAAGGTWTQAHAAAVLGCSTSSLRSSECPKDYERTPGSTVRPKLVYVPAKVRAFKASLLITAKAS